MVMKYYVYTSLESEGKNHANEFGVQIVGKYNILRDNFEQR